MDDRRYKLAELAEIVGLSEPTIRSYIQKGLIRGAGTTGPNAFYTEDHLVRLRAITLLRDEGRSLNEVRGVLLGKDTREVRELVRELSGEEDLPEDPLDLVEKAEADRIRRRMQSADLSPFGDARVEQDNLEELSLALPADYSLAPSEARMEMLAEEREHPSSASRETRPRRPSSSAPAAFEVPPTDLGARPAWIIPVSEDVDLVVRNVGNREELRRYRKLADRMRFQLEKERHGK